MKNLLNVEISEIKEFWKSHWDYICFKDAVKEVRNLGYKSIKLSVLIEAYKDIYGDWNE